MKILLLGGTGAMGNHLIDLLLDEGYLVTVTSRHIRHSNNDNLKYVHGNARDIDFLSQILTETWEVIVDFMVYKTEEFAKKMDLFLTSCNHYFFISSARVYASSKDLINEDSKRLLDVCDDSEYLKTDEYALSKARQENFLVSSNYKNWTIIRPYITYSSHRLQLGILEKESWLFRALNKKTIVFSKDIFDSITTLTYGLDVSKGISSLIGKELAKKEIFHITNKFSCKWSEILEIYLNTIEKHLKYRPKIILLDFENFSLLNQAKYQILYDRLYDRKFDNSKINKFFNIDEFKSIEIGLEECLVHFLKKPNFSAINWKNEALKDRITGEITPLREISNLKQKFRYFLFRYILNNRIIKWINTIQQKKMYKF